MRPLSTLSIHAGWGSPGSKDDEKSPGAAVAADGPATAASASAAVVDSNLRVGRRVATMAPPQSPV
jgi:hypothetical protein